MNEDILLSVEHLTHSFCPVRGLRVRAVEDLSFSVRRGEIFGLVGESGSGKSTAARCIMNLYRPEAGRILFHGIDVADAAQFRANRRYLQQSRQMIFQDPTSSLDPKRTVGDCITEPLRIARRSTARGSARAEAAFQMKYVGLDAEYLDKYPPELSGGQRQRVAIARGAAGRVWHFLSVQNGRAGADLVAAAVYAAAGWDRFFADFRAVAGTRRVVRVEGRIGF